MPHRRKSSTIGVRSPVVALERPHRGSMIWSVRVPSPAILFAIAVLALTAQGRAAEEVPRSLKAAIVLRSLAYERGLAQRNGVVVIAVVGLSGGDSAEDAKAMVGLFGKLLESTRVAERPGRVVRVVHEASPRTIKELQAHRAEVIYLAQGLEHLIASFPAIATTILVCGQGEDIGHGCTLGVELAGEKPRLILNLPQANRTGLRFEAQLMRLARVIR